MHVAPHVSTHAFFLFVLCLPTVRICRRLDQLTEFHVVCIESSSSARRAQTSPQVCPGFAQNCPGHVHIWDEIDRSLAKFGFGTTSIEFTQSPSTLPWLEQLSAAPKDPGRHAAAVER